MTPEAKDQQWMRQALDAARAAAAIGEVPIGAVIVYQDQAIAVAGNRREVDQCVTKHAEIIAIEAACKQLSSWRLTDCDLYVTLEPCLMCAGAIYQARMRRVVFGALDPKAGATGSLYQVHTDTRLNHRFAVQGGVLADESTQLLKSFFQARRQ